MNITIRRRNNKYYIDDELEVTRFKAFDVINKALALIESLSSIYTIRFKYLDEYISIELVKVPSGYASRRCASWNLTASSPARGGARWR